MVLYHRTNYVRLIENSVNFDRVPGHTSQGSVENELESVVVPLVATSHGPALQTWLPLLSSLLCTV